MPAPDWFVLRVGQRRGPLTVTDVVRELLTLPEPGDGLVWRSGLPNWTKASQLPELAGELPPPVPAVEDRDFIAPPAARPTVPTPPVTPRRRTFRNAAITWAVITFFMLPRSGCIDMLSQTRPITVGDLIAAAINLPISMTLNALLFGWITAKAIQLFRRLRAR